VTGPAFGVRYADLYRLQKHVANGAVATIAALSPIARRTAERWRKVKAEYRSAAGWHIVG